MFRRKLKPKFRNQQTSNITHNNYITTQQQQHPGNNNNNKNATHAQQTQRDDKLPWMFCFVLFFALLPTSTVSELGQALVNIGTAGRRDTITNTPREECDVQFPGGGTVNISTLPQEINGKATWVSPGGECGNVQIDQRPKNGHFYSQTSSCGFCNLVPCGLYCFANVATCPHTQIANSVAHSTPQSVKSVQNYQLADGVHFDCRPGFYKVGAVGGKILCQGDQTWTPSLCLPSVPLSEQQSNVFLFYNYKGGILNINATVNSPNNIKIGLFSYETATVNVYGAYASRVTRIHTITYETSTVTCQNCQPDYHTTSNYIGRWMETKKQKISKFDQIFNEHVDKIKCQSSDKVDWGGNEYKLSFVDAGQLPFTCGGGSCPDRGCPTDSPMFSPHVFEPIDLSALKSGIQACFSETSDLSCPLFSADNGAVGDWDVSKVTDMENVFEIPNTFNIDLSKWDTSRVINMKNMFSGVSWDFRGNGLGEWDVSRVTSMENMFQRCSRFNGDLSKWNVAKVTTMKNMFLDCTDFNNDISKWQTNNLIEMDEMFNGATKFNADTSKWDVAKVTSVFKLFRRATVFNRDLSKWNVANVRRFSYVFRSASQFNFKDEIDVTWNVNSNFKVGVEKFTDSCGSSCGVCGSHVVCTGLSKPTSTPCKFCANNGVECCVYPTCTEFKNSWCQEFDLVLKPNPETKTCSAAQCNENDCCGNLCPATQVKHSNKNGTGAIQAGGVGASVQVTCDLGWSGSNTMVCGADLRWGPVVACTPNSCTATRIANSNKATENSITGTTGESEFVSCNPGYSGNFSTSCLPTGVFDDRVQCTECPTGKYNNEMGQPKCKNDCGAGSYISKDSTNCLVCPYGQWQDQDGQHTCVKCESGKYLKQSQQTSNNCQDCIVGRYSPDLGHDESCYPCVSAVGKGATECIQCVPGRFVVSGTSTNGDECNECSLGKYSDESDQKNCKNCTVGRYTHDGRRNLCQGCKRGTYGDIEGQFSAKGCKNCTAGRYSDIDGLRKKTAKVACNPCPKGRWNSMAGQNKLSDCILCGTGKYGTTEAAVELRSCMNCAAGTFSVTVGSEDDDSCNSCPKGFAQQFAGHAYCLPCVPGKYNDQKGQSLCEECSVNTYRGPNDPAGSCVDCEIGQFSLNGSAVCISCIPGQAGSPCTSCLEGKYRGPSDDAKACLDCGTGTFSTPGSAVCLSCSPGKYNYQTGQRVCKKCSVNTYRGPNDPAGSCVDCEIGKTSVAGSAMCTSCIPGQAGSPCTRCLEGKYRGPSDDAKACLDCGTGTFSTPGSLVCSGCELGTFGSAPGICDPCENQKYSDGRGQTTCTDCPVGKVPNEQKTGCERPAWTLPGDCEPKTQYLDDKSPVKANWKCLECPTGVVCSSTSRFSSLAMKPTGYFNATWGKYPAFFPCPTPKNCRANHSDPCLRNTNGPLCNVCISNHFMDNSGACKSCATSSNWSQLVVVVFLLFCLGGMYQTFKKKAKHLYRRFGRDIIRILTINLGFAQINSTLPSVISIPWPESYIQYVRSWGFVNFDISSLFNLSCVQDWDYRSIVGMACLFPWLIGVVFFASYLIQRNRAIVRITKGLSKKALTNVSENIFLLIDSDGQGQCDTKEINDMLHAIQLDNDQARMELKTISNNNQTAFTQEDLAKAFGEKDFAKTKIGGAMIRWSEMQRIRSERLSTALLILFLLHAPISQRIFLYFVCDDIAGKRFLKSDYVLNCDEATYVSFRIVPLFMLLLFTIGFPLVIFALLFASRNQLHTVKVRKQLGFLYAPFKTGAEYWEIHELIRKALLMGALVLLNSTKLRMVVALIVCVFSVASLHYFRPHRNPIVLLVSQSSFLLTTFKYIVAVIMIDLSKRERDALGIVLIFLDVCFVLGSVMSIFAVLYLLAKQGKEDRRVGNVVVPAVTSPRPPSTAASYAALKSRTSARLQTGKSLRTRTVEKIEKTHAVHRASHVDKTNRRHSQRRASLQIRIQKRKKAAENFRMKKKKGNDGPGQQHVKDAAYDKEKKTFAKRILHIRTKKKDILIQCFERLAPVGPKNLVVVLRKLKVSKAFSGRMATEIVESNGMNLTISLKQFLNWAECEGV